MSLNIILNSFLNFQHIETLCNILIVCILKKKNCKSLCTFSQQYHYVLNPWRSQTALAFFPSHFEFSQNESNVF